MRGPLLLPLLAVSILWLAAQPLCAAVAVRDAAGRELVLDAPARRVVALAPHIVENLFAVGAGGSLVGAVSYADYPEAARSIPRVGQFNAFSLEAIIALRPDLIVMWGSGNGPAALQRLQSLDVPVFVSELRRLADIPRSLRSLGAVTGNRGAGELAAARFEREIAALRRSRGEARELSVLFQLWHRPLQTVGGDHLISEIIGLCGGRNAFAGARGLAPTLNLESVLAANPEVIVASGAGRERPPWLDEWRQYPSLAAVRNDALFYLDPDTILRPTPRVLAGARELCARLEEVRAR
jgi:iron complex transport system substrate-binding protein